MGRKKRKRENDQSDDDDKVPMCEREKDTTVVSSLANHVKHPAVLQMVAKANEAWDGVTCFGNDVVHSYCLHALTKGLPLPDLVDKDFWMFVLGYTIKRSTQKRGQLDDLVKAFTDHYDMCFAQHDTLRPGYHDNFIENMATLEATNNKV